MAPGFDFVPGIDCRGGDFLSTIRVDARALRKSLSQDGSAPHRLLYGWTFAVEQSIF